MAIAAQEYMPSRIDDLCVNTLRFLSVDAVERAGSGHPGLPLGASPMAFVLWTHYLRHNPKNPVWFDRDRFVLSAGHGSALLYGLLYLTGYDLPIEQIKMFRQWGSMTPGHPESGLTPGVDVTTGPLGQGFGNGVGMAMAEAHLAARFNRPGLDIINHHTYGILSDGDMMEGASSEAASLAGHLRLGKLIYLYDCNHISLSAATSITFTEDTFRRFESYGWHTQFVDDGNNLWAIDQALRAAHEETSRPSLVIVNTHIGFGSPRQDSFEAHGAPLGGENVRAAKKRLGWLVDSEFLVPDEAKTHMRRAVEQGRQAEDDWGRRLAEYQGRYPAEAAELARFMSNELPEGWDNGIPLFQPGEMLATRKASGIVMNAVAKNLPSLFGGSADVNPSTHTALEGQGDFSPPERGEQPGGAGGGASYAGRNIFFGVREHCMGTVLNGVAAHGGLVPYGSTFLIFSDYMRPPMRIAALSGLNVVYVFTHDSIGLGEDGPTHQPVEQLASLRAVPRLVVIRPCDANETAAAWRAALLIRDRPVALALTRQKVPTLDRSRYAPASNLDHGAYILSEADGHPDIILMASGSEVQLALGAQERLHEEGVRARVVSFPSWELFAMQPREYRDWVLPPIIPARLAVEAGSPQGWCSYVGDRGDVVGVESFGASAPGEVVLERYGFTVEKVCARARAVINYNSRQWA